MGKTITSLFSIPGAGQGRPDHLLQLSKDTFGTAATFRTGGEAVFRADPKGVEVVL